MGKNQPKFDVSNKDRPIHYIVKEDNGKWYDKDGNIICEEINGEWITLPQYEYDTIDFSSLL